MWEDLPELIFRDLDDTWPDVGSRFHHRVGVGWLSIPDSTEVEDIAAPGMRRCIEFEVTARCLTGSAAGKRSERFAATKTDHDYGDLGSFVFYRWQYEESVAGLERALS